MKLSLYSVLPEEFSGRNNRALITICHLRLDTTMPINSSSKTRSTSLTHAQNYRPTCREDFHRTRHGLRLARRFHLQVTWRQGTSWRGCPGWHSPAPDTSHVQRADQSRQERHIIPLIYYSLIQLLHKPDIILTVYCEC